MIVFWFKVKVPLSLLIITMGKSFNNRDKGSGFDYTYKVTGTGSRRTPRKKNSTHLDTVYTLNMCSNKFISTSIFSVTAEVCVCRRNNSSAFVVCSLKFD